jgi:putative tricarboxylic transport membrane protein
MLVFGMIGYVLRRAGYPLAPLIIGMILGGIMESNLRRSLLISQDGLMIFVERPTCAIILAIDVVLLVSIIYSTFRSSRRTEDQGDDPVKASLL